MSNTPDADARQAARQRYSDACRARDIRERLEELRAALRAESISYGELFELQSLAPHIEPGDVELLEAAGVPEFDDDDEPKVRR